MKASEYTPSDRILQTFDISETNAEPPIDKF